MRDLGLEPLTSPAPTPQGRHVGLRPGLIDEDQPSRINPILIFLLARTTPRHVGAILLGRQNAFFEAHTFLMDESPIGPIIHLEANQPIWESKIDQLNLIPL
jgi:hypothetical protein